MLSEDDSHRRWAENEIQQCIDRYEYSPVIFLGSGISQRYLDAPPWRGLLSDLINDCPHIEYPLEYYEEEYDLPKIGSKLIDPYREWAWSDKGDNNDFPSSIFESEGGKDKYLKYKVAEFFKDLSPDSEEDINDRHSDEIKALQNINPTAVITTNYDTLLETIFPGFQPMVSQEIFENDRKEIGDLFKIHGCESERQSIILTNEDYKKFNSDHMYISAKLMTYFTEHPVLIVGYEPDDPNIQKILSDLNKMTKNKDNMIDNIFIANYVDDPEELADDPELPRKQTIELNDRERIYVRSLTYNSLEWIFSAFSQEEPIEDVDYKTVREFTSKLYNITTKEAPRKKINYERVNYLSEGDHIEKLLGFVPVDNPETVDAMQEAGIPIGEGEVSTEPVEEINNRLKTATQDYRSNGTVISDRGVVLEFRKRKNDLELTEYTTELLLRSSIANGFQGADWMIETPIDVVSVLKEIYQSDWTHKRNIPRVAYNLLLLDQKEPLDELYDIHLDNGKLKKDLRKYCNKPLEDKISSYSPTNTISLKGTRIKVKSLINDDDKVDRHMNILGDVIIEEEKAGGSDSQNRVYFRQLELVKIANNLDRILNN